MAVSAWPRSPTHEANAGNIPAIWKRRKKRGKKTDQHGGFACTFRTRSNTNQHPSSISLLSSLVVDRHIRRQLFPSGSVFCCLDQELVTWHTCSKDDNLQSVFSCLGQGWRSVVCFLPLGAGMAICNPSSSVWIMDQNLWSVFSCLGQGQQSMICLWMLWARAAAVYGPPLAFWIRNGNL